MRKKVKIMLLAGIFLAAYYGFVRRTGIGVPCLFRSLFHLQCPGCGITHMAVAASRGRLREAFQYHPVIFAGSPFLVWICVRLLYSWLRDCRVYWRVWERAGMNVFLVFLMVFTVWRNIC